jgi:hypothetical protein
MNLFAMFTCYFDEAISDERKFTLVAGYVASLKEWELFEIDWKIFLAKFRIPYLHMAKLSQWSKPYDTLRKNDALRARILATAGEIIQAHAKKGFCYYVDHDDFEILDREYMLHEFIPSPYALAGRLCVMEANEWRRKSSSHLDLEYIFEDGGPDKGGLMQAMDIRPKLPAPIFKPSRDIVDRKVGLRRGVVQLQAGDYLAYELRKFAVDYHTSRKGKVRKSLIALTGVPVRPRFVDRYRLGELCRSWHAGNYLKKREGNP